MTKAQEQMLTRFREKFTINNPTSGNGVWWIVPTGGNPEVASPREVEQFILEESDRLLTEERERITKEAKWMKRGRKTYSKTLGEVYLTDNEVDEEVNSVLDALIQLIQKEI